jgi:hypothetical protein
MRVPLSIQRAGNPPIPLLQGRITEVQFQGTTYQVFGHTSAYRRNIMSGDEVRSGYVLRALILEK